MIRICLKVILEILWYDWQQVGVFKTEIQNNAAWNRPRYDVYIHCFESRWGSRRAKIIVVRPNMFALFNKFLVRRVRFEDIYQTEILPWLRGRQHSKIPSYQVVRKGTWDFKKILNGESPIVINDEEKD